MKQADGIRPAGYPEDHRVVLFEETFSETLLGQRFDHFRFVGAMRSILGKQV